MRPTEAGRNLLNLQKNLMQGQIGGAEAFGREIALVPVRIDQRNGTDLGETRDFFCS